MSTAAATQVTPERIMQLSWGYAPPLILEAAIRHRVFDVLDAGPKNLEELHTATGASSRGLAAIANVLVGLNLLAKDEAGRFSLTPESAAFLVSSKPGFMGGMILHLSSQLIPKWLEINEIVGTGAPAGGVNQQEAGSAFFEQFVLDIFPMSYPAAKTLAGHFQFNGATPVVSVLDLAAGSGVWGIALAQSSPAVRVTAVDWPGVLSITEKTVDEIRPERPVQILSRRPALRRFWLGTPDRNARAHSSQRRRSSQPRSSRQNLRCPRFRRNYCRSPSSW